MNPSYMFQMTEGFIHRNDAFWGFSVQHKSYRDTYYLRRDTLTADILE